VFSRASALIVATAFLFGPLSTACIADSSSAIGKASYYRHGSKTANGEKFNPKGLTAAHRTLKFGTRVKVTHLRSGRSVIVRINDRGPFIKSRIIDLSYGAAVAIGLEKSGVANVRIVVLQREERIASKE
jgi:rare lipoprotein A